MINNRPLPLYKLNERGKPYAAKSVASMVRGTSPR